MNTVQRSFQAIEAYLKNPSNGLDQYVEGWRLLKPKSDIGVTPPSAWRNIANSIVSEFNSLPGNTPSLDIGESAIKNSIENCYDLKLQEFARFIYLKAIELRDQP